MTPNSAIFAPILIFSLFVFCCSCYRRLSLVTVGSADDRFDSTGERWKEMLLYAFGQKRVVSRLFGINHFVIFWSFLVLALANAEFLLHGVFPAVSLKMLPASVQQPLLLMFDIFSLAALVAVGVAAVRRMVAPPYEGARTGEAFFILAMIATLMLAYFGLRGAEIALGHETASEWLPVSSFVAALLPGGSNVTAFASFCWWLHAVVLLLFMNFLPYSKHMHILTAIPNAFFMNLEQPNTQPREVFVPGNVFGAGSVDRLTWKDLLDSYSCTECGRCQQACPAAATGKPLNPRQLIHDIKTNLLANAPAIARGGEPALPLIGPDGAGCISEEALWSCTSCGACMAACPVFIEHLPKVVKMRRHLVEMQAKFPEELLNLFENMEQRSNPWGIAPSERTKWCSQLEVKPFEAGKTEYLLFVGCAGTFDSRNKQVSLALASILDAAGVSWGTLGREEKCCGESLRRLGNEYVFDRMAKENVELFKAKGVTRIITQCPHCFTALKNDYAQYGLTLEVIPHSEFIRDLLDSGRLKLNRQVTELGSLVFHDSCYLGRHNGVYEAPRQVAAAVTGEDMTELERSREQSFCCGAGGGRMWMEEHEGSRINLNRVEEALRKNPDTICVTCPYCMTMFEDGLKDKQAAQTRVKDIAEVVAEGLRVV